MEMNAVYREPIRGRNMETEFTAVRVARAVQFLRERVAKDKIAKDVFHVMSIRERARNVITLGGLQQRMKKEGYNYEMGDYAGVLKVLADLDFGSLMTDSRGKIVGLKDIKITLQSIGRAALGESDDLVGWKPRNKYVPLADAIPPESVIESPRRIKTKETIPTEENLDSHTMVLRVLINGRPVNIPIPKEMPEKEVANLIVTLRQVSG